MEGHQRGRGALTAGFADGLRGDVEGEVWHDFHGADIDLDSGIQVAIHESCHLALIQGYIEEQAVVAAVNGGAASEGQMAERGAAIVRQRAKQRIDVQPVGGVEIVDNERAAVADQVVSVAAEAALQIRTIGCVVTGDEGVCQGYVRSGDTTAVIAGNIVGDCAVDQFGSIGFVKHPAAGAIGDDIKRLPSSCIVARDRAAAC